jgi:orotate phosphoribosyltransferase
MSDLSKALMDCGALQFGEFTLASGAKSSYYIDIKRASTDPKVLKIIARNMAENLKKSGLKIDRIAGVVLGSVPLAAALALETGIPYAMIRKEKKDHGTGKLIEGVLNAGDSVLVVEDVITSAGSSMKAIETLRAEGAKVENVFSVIDREAGGAENLASIGVKLTPLVKASELL